MKSTNKILDSYLKYKESFFTNRMFKHADILPLLNQIASKEKCEIKEIGKSLEGRSIHLVKFGSGKRNILGWSQMHGNEPTATMALFDLFNFLSAKDEFNLIRTEIAKEFTLHFIVMLNPDGTERFQRRNSQNADLNRDANSKVFPEIQLLFDYKNKIKPEVAFNLHDQRTRFNVGGSSKPATISFLAPAYNYAREINEPRGKAMKLIASMNAELQNHIPGHIGKYNDAFYPTSCGDKFTESGIPTILIESGGYYNDPHRAVARKMNFLAILKSLESLSTNSLGSIEEYNSIPINEEKMVDVILRNVTLETGQKVDIGIDYLESKPLKNGYLYNSLVRDIGDLSFHFGYQEYDCSMYTIKSKLEIDKTATFELSSKKHLFRIKNGDLSSLSE